MANNANGKIITLDNTGIFLSGKIINITGIAILASATTWAAQLLDNAGNTIFEANQNTVGSSGFALGGSIQTAGVRLGSCTAITRIFVYLQ